MPVLADDEVCLLLSFGQGPSVRELQNLEPDLVTDCPKPWLLLVLSRLVWELILHLGGFTLQLVCFSRLCIQGTNIKPMARFRTEGATLGTIGIRFQMLQVLQWLFQRVRYHPCLISPHEKPTKCHLIPLKFMQILSPHPSKAFGYERQIGYVLTVQFTVGFKCSTHYWACTWMEPSDINTYWIWCQETDQTSISLLYYSYDPLIWVPGCCASDEVKLEFNFHLWPALEQPVVSSLVFSLHWGLFSLLLLVPSFGKTEGFFTPNYW
jgi:hypothetical protein